MRIECGNCGAIYRVPNAKLVKKTNRATCHDCGHKLLIPKPEEGFDDDTHIVAEATPPPASSPEENIDEDAALKEPTETEETPELEDAVEDLDADPTDEAPFPEPDSPPDPHTTSPEDNEKLPNFLADLGLSVEEKQTPTKEVITIGPDGAKNETVPVEAQVELSGDFDPSDDLSFVMLGAGVSLVGACFLCMLSLLPTGSAAAILLCTLGFSLASIGSLLALLVLITGQRGRQPARIFFSVAGAFGMTFVMTLVVVGGQLAVQKLMVEQEGTENTEAVVATVDPKPEVEALLEEELEAPSDDIIDETLETPEDTDTPPPPVRSVAPMAPPEPPPLPNTNRPVPQNMDLVEEELAVPDEGSVPTAVDMEEALLDDDAFMDLPEDGDDGVAATNTTPKPQPAKPAPKKTAAAKAPKKTKSGKDDALPQDVLNLMLHNNIEIKRCVFQYMQEENKRPKSFSITFMLEPTGRARRVRIPQAIYAGTSFETCLSAVISDLTFPPFGGPPTSKTVQFKME